LERDRKLFYEYLADNLIVSMGVHTYDMGKVFKGIAEEKKEKKMIKKKMLMETIGKKWGAYGFQFEEYDYYRWTFSRRVDEVDQKISIQEGIYGYPELRFEVELFRGSERKDVGKSKIQELSGLKEFGMFLPYKGEEELRELLNKWGDLIGEKVIDRLADIPVKWHEWPGRESEKKLYEKREELAERFYKRHGIDEEAAEEILLGKMKEELDEIIGKPLAKVEERMVELAAVYGKLWIRMFKGEWMYKENDIYGGALITKSTCHNIYPLKKITAYWHAEWDEILEDYAEEKKEYEEHIKTKRRKRK